MATTFTVTHNGTPTDRSSYFRVEGMEINKVLNGRATLRCNTDDWLNSYRPTVNDELTVVEDGTTIFGGVITEVTEVPKEHDVGVVCSITAADFNSYPDFRIISSISFSPGTYLKTILQTLLTNYLSAYGVTLWGSQDNGPQLDGTLSWENKRVSDALNELTSLSGRVWIIDASKVLSMRVPGTLSAPFALSSAIPPNPGVQVTMDSNTYANRYWVQLGSTQVLDTAESTVADGTSPWIQLHYSPYPNGQFSGTITVDGVYYAVGVYPDTLWLWTHDAATNRFHYRDGNIPAGSNCSWHCNVQFPIMLYAEDATEVALHGVREALQPISDCYDYFQGLQIAQGYLTRSLEVPKKVSYTIDGRPGLEPGMLQAITLPSRNLSGNYIIEEVHLQGLSPWLIRYTVTVTGGTTYTGSWLDKFRLWNGSSSSFSSGGGVWSSGSAVAQASWMLSASTTDMVRNPSANSPTAVPQAIRHRLSSSRCAGLTLQVRARVWVTSNATVTLRFRNVTDGTNAASSSATVCTVTGGVPDVAEIVFPVTLTTGDKDYELWWESSSAGVTLGALAPVLESV